MKIKVFTKPECPNCPPAKKLAEVIKNEKKLSVELYDVEDPDGLAEAQFYSVMATPSVILTDDSEKEIIGWRGVVPAKKEVYDKML